MSKTNKTIRTKTIRWKHTGFRVKTRPEPEAARKEITRIKDKCGEVTPAAIVTESKKKKAVFHPSFLWDDKAAGHRYRLDQARELVNSLEVVLIDREPSGETREMAVAPAFISMDHGHGGTGYTSIDVVMDDDVLRDRFIAQAKRDLENWAKRYDHLQEFAKIRTSISNLLEAV